MEPSFFGWELIRAAHRAQFKSDIDIGLAFVHWRLLYHPETKFLFCGEGENFSAADKLSELLPPTVFGDEKREVYHLKYRVANEKTKKFLLTVMSDSTVLIFNLIRISDEVVSTLTLKPSDFAKAMEDGEPEALMKTVDQGLFTDKMFPKEKKKETENPKPSSSSSLLQEPRPFPRVPFPPEPHPFGPNFRYDEPGRNYGDEFLPPGFNSFL